MRCTVWESNPSTLALQGHQDAGIAPSWACARCKAKVTNCSDQFGFPVEFLQPCIQFAIPLCELIHFHLQLSDRHGRNESHLRLRVTILPGACGVCDSCEEIATLAGHATFGNCIRNRTLVFERSLRVGAVDCADEFQKTREDAFGLRKKLRLSSAGCSPSCTRADRISRFLISSILFWQSLRSARASANFMVPPFQAPSITMIRLISAGYAGSFPPAQPIRLMIQSLYGSNSFAPAIATPTGVRRCRMRTVSPTDSSTSSRRL
jgi:hypothetical protein